MQWIIGKIGEVWGFILQLAIYGLLFGALVWVLTDPASALQMAKNIGALIAWPFVHGMDAAKAIGNFLASL
jgi:hypothetical protein